MPLLTVFAGPNGSGKSSLIRQVDFEGRENLLEPDAVARRFNPELPREAGIAAGREVLRRTAEYIRRQESFAIVRSPHQGEIPIRDFPEWVCVSDPSNHLKSSPFSEGLVIRPERGLMLPRLGLRGLSHLSVPTARRGKSRPNRIR